MDKIKRVIFYFILYAALFSGLVWIYSKRILRGEDVTAEMVALIEKSKSTKQISLKDFKEGKWDSLTIWYPYMNIRQLNLDGVLLLGENDGSNLNESTNIILFLKNNRISAYAEFSRQIADFSEVKKDDVSRHILREATEFYFEEKNNFPRVILKGSK